MPNELLSEIKTGDTVAVSACLIGINCKYNGGNNLNTALRDWLQDKKCIPVCPEVLGGLPTPRTPAEIVNGVVINKDSVRVHENFVRGAQIALEQIKAEDPKIVILQSRSPSCGVKEVYDGTFSGKRIEGSGVFTRLLQQSGYPVLDIADFNG